MKIAVASDDKKTISHHFGKAKGFVVIELENKKIVSKEYRENIGKNKGECGSCDHSAMINNVKDCELVISYGMGQRIYDDLTKEGIKPIVTDEKTVDGAISRFLENNLENMTKKIH